MLGPLTVGLLANPFAWAIYLFVASKVVEAQERDKDFQSQLLYLNVSAHALNAFEEKATVRIIADRPFTTRQQRDQRLDRRLLGSHLALDGWRTTYEFSLQPGEVTKFRKLRWLSLEYLRLRAGHGYRMLRWWKPEVRLPGDVNPTTGRITGAWGFSQSHPGYPYDTWQTMYEDPLMPGSLPGIGGLYQIPLAALGYTESARLDDTTYPADVHQLRALLDVSDPISDVGLVDLQMVRLAALLEALYVVRWDARPFIDLDAQVYAEDVFNALAAPGATRYASNGDLMTPGPRTPLEGLSVRNGHLITDATVFGKAVAINVQAIRQNTNAAGHPQVQELGQSSTGNAR